MFCVSVMARWRVCGIVQVGKRFWDRGFAVSTVNCLSDFQAVKREFQAASDGPRELCCCSAFADARRSSAVRLQFAASPSFAIRRNPNLGFGIGEQGLTTQSGPSPV